MSRRTASRATLAALVAVVGLVGLAPSAVALPARIKFVGPVFGLSASGKTLFAADAGAGIRRISATGAKQRLIEKLPGVTDVAPLGHGRMWAVASTNRSQALYFRTKKGRLRMVANLGRFEKRRNPDGAQVDSNPFDLEALGDGRVLIADAGANDLLVADRKGHVNWIATFPSQEVSTSDIKDLVGCPNPNQKQICNLPDEMRAQAVSTSVAVGPDGAYYVTELKGFPAPRNRSRVWRIDPDVHHVQCEGSVTTNGCTVAARNLTSLVDINFDSGTALVVELDEATWFAVEELPKKVEGGTVDQCDTSVMPWDCTILTPNLVQPMAVTLTSNGTRYALIRALKRRPGVIKLT
jgi:hypothetical protein